jgi:heme/copper-type cytochrome/quinol oxidase subunit 2
MNAARAATPEEKKVLVVHSRLLLAVVLVVLLVMLMMTFRISRFFAARGRSQRNSTQYIDAWSESGRRLRVPPQDPR